MVAVVWVGDVGGQCVGGLDEGLVWWCYVMYV